MEFITNCEEFKAELKLVADMFYNEQADIKIVHTLNIEKQNHINKIEIIKKSPFIFKTNNTVPEDLSNIESKKLTKRYAKLCLYQALSKHNRKKLPWGSLTGVRPTKLAYELLSQGKYESKIEDDRALDSYGKDTSQLIDNIIRSAMAKRTSDIHIEPMEDKVRVRYRIDGELLVVANIEKSKQAQVIGRLKSISNMHQEVQLSQDGRILLYPDYNIRVSSQMNVHGEKFVLRLMKKEAHFSGLQELGYPDEETVMEKCFNKRNCIAVIAAPTGEGKTTTLYSALALLNKPEVNITTVEDPVEIRIPGLNQVEVNKRVSFADSLRTILRQDPDIILLRRDS